MNAAKRVTGVSVVTALITLGAAFCVPSYCYGQGKKGAAANGPQAGVLQIGEITIVGRILRPIATVEVNKLDPKLTLGELKQPFLDQIELVLRRDPF